ncbi:diguanylate cyclase domain-containing protein [Kineococcus glutinatus]|uniref:PAS domain S-box-containing protein/diguanylate cyclase (GGDEF)-like protein n=1 Tax=Kineococcus glutinatus TaxID=1070872 RepID=A0ABP9HKY5_9ACTN
MPLAAGGDGVDVRLHAAYQPIVDLRSREVVAVEGLIRGARGPALVMPTELFARAAGQGDEAVRRLDESCVRTILTTAAAAAAHGTVFINVEPVTLAELSRRTLAELASLVPAGVRVVVEVTERDLLREPARLLAGVDRVRELGWAVALDDVGAEPAALALMPFLHPDVIKLDLALVHARPTSQVAAIVNAVNAEAQRSGAVVLAEGIETPEHADRALAVGAALGQGWLFARAEPRPPSWGGARIPTGAEPAPPREGASAFELLARTRPAQPSTAALVGAVTRHVERQAMLLDDMTVVLACFQHADFLTDRTLRRYEALASVTALTAVLGPGVPAAPCTGVEGTALAPDDPLGRDWVVAVTSPHFAVALAARDTGAPRREDLPAGGEGGGGRRMEYVLTYDRDEALAVARLLMGRVRTTSTAAPPAAVPPDDPGTAAGTAAGGPAPAPTAAAVVPGVPPGQLPDLLARAIGTAANGITIADAREPDMPLVYVNPAFERLTGYRSAEVLGTNCRFLQGPGTDRTQVATIARRLRAGRSVRVTLLNHRRDGSPFWNEISISPVADAQGRTTHFIGNQVDVTDRVEREQRTAFLAYHDSLTGLPNRAQALEQLDLELRRRTRSGAGVAVLFCDLDGFKEVNDRFGHSAGDEVLVAVAHRLRSAVRGGDLLARLGGDEFLVLLTGLPADDAGPARRVAGNLHAALVPPLELAGTTVRITTSIGVALCPRDGTDATALLDHADADMYRTKRRV